jgi:hypothetical protein
MYSSAFCSVGLKAYNLKSPNLSLDEVYQNSRYRLICDFNILLYLVIYATSFCVNWAFLIARGTRLKHERSEGFKASRVIRKAQFT